MKKADTDAVKDFIDGAGASHADEFFKEDAVKDQAVGLTPPHQARKESAPGSGERGSGSASLSIDLATVGPELYEKFGSDILKVSKAFGLVIKAATEIEHAACKEDSECRIDIKNLAGAA